MRRPTLLLVLVLSIACACAFASPAWADRGVSVPRVVGLDLEHATRRLESANLDVALVWTAEGRPGRVQTQRPAPGNRVPTGTTVELVVTRLVRVETIVPDVVGLAVDVVVTALEEVYVLEIGERSARGRRGGEVVSQEPRAGTRLALGGVLRLVVGRAPHGDIEFPLPDVRHMVLDEAEGVLLDLGLIPVPVFVRSRHGAQGRVRRQRPEPETHVTYGARVELEVRISRGAARRVRVPSLYGLDPTEAAHALEALGLVARAERLPSRFDQDTVLRQKPEAGTRATAGSAVRLVVAFPAARTHAPARVEVPRLEGLALAAAFARARRSGIQLEVRRRPGAAGQGAGIVLAQRPTAGAAVPLGTRVRVEVPRGVPHGVPVPDLVGLAPDAAAQSVWEAGLRLAFEGGMHVPRGALVVAQTPQAGTVVTPDSVVRVVLAMDAGIGRVLVPDVRGATTTQAEERLRAAGLRTQLSGPPIPAGASTRVTLQAPLPGARLPRGATVQVAYRLTAGGESPFGFVRVPDLTGRSLVDAQRLLLERGLVGVASAVRGPGRKGVTGQLPAPGTRVRRGVKVRFTVRR